MEMMINGNKLYYEVNGNPDGDTIFFIHGAPGLGDCRSDVKSFSALGDTYQLVFMDMRGSGRSGDNPPFTHEQWTADIEEVRKKLVDGPIKILGGSYGGHLALEYVLNYPAHVTHVILRDTTPSNDFRHITRDKALESKDVLLSEGDINRLFEGHVDSNEELKALFAAIQPLYTVDYDEDAVKKRIESIYYHYETHNFAFNTNKPNYNLIPDLYKITIPMLVTVGRYDWFTPVVASEIIAENVPNSELVIFEKSGHSPQVEENEEYLKLVREFLQKKL